MDVPAFQNQEYAPKVQLFRSWRLRVSLLCMGAIAISNIFQKNLYISQSCIFEEINATTHKPGRYAMSGVEKGNMFNGYNYGLIWTQILGGALSYRFGSTKVLVISLIVSSIATTALPFSFQLGIGAAVVSRIILGLSSGLKSAAVFQLASAWFPDNERGILIGIISMGNRLVQAWPLTTICLLGRPLGIILAHPISIELCYQSIPFAWQWSFFGPAIFGLIFVVVCMFFMRSNPSDHNFITGEELQYISQRTQLNAQQTNIPWIPLLKQKAIIGFFISFAAEHWFFTILSVFIWPILMSNKAEREKYKILVFWIVYLIAVPIFGAISDFIEKRYICSRKRARQLYVGIATLVPAVLTLILAFLSDGKDKPVLIFVMFIIIHIAYAANSGGGISLSPTDMAPDYTGAVWGIGHTVATGISILTTMIISFLQEKYDNIWMFTMISSTVANLISAVNFWLLVDADNLFEEITEFSTELEHILHE